MKSKHTILYLVTGGVVAVAAFLTYTCITTARNPEINYLNYQVQSDNAQISNINTLSKKMTTQNILEDITKENINVTESLESTSDHIKEAIDLVYNKTKSQEDYDKLSKKLPKLVGNSMSEKLLEISRPTTNQAGQTQPIFNKTDNVLVTFGKYNYQTTVVPVYVAVDYEIPNVNNQSSNLKGEDLYILTYNLKSKKLELQRRITN